MADWSQFEGFETGAEARPAQCMVCEAMLPEAVDGTLSAAEQRAFDQHVAGCVHCAQELDEAQRGAAWLAMLKTQTPEPPARLLAKILAETTGAEAVAMSAAQFAAPPLRDEATQGWATRSSGGRSSWVAEFGRKLADAFSFDAARTTFQPRLAMTAAMAFFSIALTLNLTGVRLRDVRAGNFTPSGIRRTVADAGASAMRNFQSLRVVYQVESRVSELRSDEAPGNGREAMEPSSLGSDGAAANRSAQPGSAEPQRSEPQSTGTASGAQDSGKQEPAPQDSKPKGHSDLVLPLPERGLRGGSVVRKEV